MVTTLKLPIFDSMAPDEVYTLGILMVVLGLFVLHVYPGSTLIPLGLMFIGVLAVVLLIKGVVIILCGGGINALLAGTMFLVIIAFIFDGLHLVVYGVKLVLTAAVAILQVLASVVASLL